MLNKSSFNIQLEHLVKIPQDYTYLLAVSGGADSMVLLNLFNELFPSKEIQSLFHVAHINYKLRGKDSDSDQKIVQDFCNQHSIPFHLYEVSESDKKPENSIQLWARDLRYSFFNKIRNQESLDFLVTGHHLNDQLETFLINLSKASGIKGLSGIPANENNILRPLLFFSKQNIYEFAEISNIEFREDLSNKKNDYLRNKIRNQIVPQLLETNTHFLDNFRKSSLYLNQTKDFVEARINEIENNLSIPDQKNKVFNKEKFSLESDFVKFEILKKYGFNKEKEISKIFTAESGSFFLSTDFQLITHRNELIILARNQPSESEKEIIVIKQFDFSKKQMTLNVKNIIENIGEINASFEWNFDAEKIHFPLTLRKKQEGDLFYPKGSLGKKKVSKFFRDEKLSILAKKNIWLLTDNNNSILGVIPLRQDRRYTKDEETEFVLQIFNKEKHEI